MQDAVHVIGHHDEGSQPYPAPETFAVAPLGFDDLAEGR